MRQVEFFKLQAKNLYRDYKTQFFDENEGVYDYRPSYFDVNQIVTNYDINEEDFCLMKAQHVIALMVGFESWGDLIKASEAALELAKLLFDNQDKIHIEEWKMYVANAEHKNNGHFEPEVQLEIFKGVFLNETHKSQLSDYRLKTRFS